MAKLRSPNYPSMTLTESIEAIRPAFLAEHRNKMSRQVLAKHLGYNSLNGRSLAKIGAVRSYGLIDGMGEELRVSDDAVILLNAPTNSDERLAARERAETRPALFKQLRQEFPTCPSEDNLRYELIKCGFTKEAAGRAAKTYLANMESVASAKAVDAQRSGKLEMTSDESEQCDLQIEVGDLVQVEIGGALQLEKPQRVRAVQEHEGRQWIFIETSVTGVLMDQAVLVAKAVKGATEILPPNLPFSKPIDQEHGRNPTERRLIFALKEGDVVVSFPANLSPESVEDLEGYLEVFVRKARREAGLPVATSSFGSSVS